MPAGLSLLSVPVAIVALAGAAAGVGGYTLLYARAPSYLTDDAAACANCHVMRSHYEAWLRGPHHAAATCNDCHTPSGLDHWVVKAENGAHHSSAFTMGTAPDVLHARESTRRVIEGRCRECHAAMLQSMPGGSAEISCIRCHASVGHLE